MMKNVIISILVLFWVSLCFAQSPLVYLKYDEASGTQVALDDAGGLSFQVTNTFDNPERVGGVAGNALRTDGFSTWASRDLAYDFQSELTVETWVSLESYPSDHEVPYASLSPSAIISQVDGDLGYEIGVNTFGVWWFSVNIDGQKYTCQAPEPFPLYSWVHVAGVVDGAASSIKLFLNGQQVASATIPTNGVVHEATNPLIIGKGNNDAFSGIFLINALSAAIDETKIFASAKTDSIVSSEYQSMQADLPTTGFESLIISDSRFDHDLQRPLYHAMPPANWTNEPHGLVEYNGEYHLFYQRTPNGPFKTMMHWGHMVSTDFVNWENQKDALWPTLESSPTSGYDMKGIWSGDVVVANDTAHAFYTNVNHTGPYNPGIAHAFSNDLRLENWTKMGPVIDKQGVADFRDPYLWKEGNTWHMIIGAKMSSGRGGLSYYTSNDLANWTLQPQFTSLDFEQVPPSQSLWEMPVFEPIGGGKHVLIVNPIPGDGYTRAVYWTGVWSGGIFTPDYTQPKNLDLIHGHLSPTVARNTDGELVGIGIVDERWNSEAQLESGWCHTFSLPRVYSLLSDGETLGQRPAPQLSTLRIPGSEQQETSLVVTGTQKLDAAGRSMELIVELDTSTTASAYGVNFYVSEDRQEITRLYYDKVNQKIVLDKLKSSLSPNSFERMEYVEDYDEQVFGKPYKFHIFLDHSAIDVFINGKAAFSNRVYPTRLQSKGVELFSDGGATTFTAVQSYKLGPNGEDVPIEDISFIKENVILPLTTTKSLVASIMPVSATNQRLIWTSSNEEVVTVMDGQLTPHKKGTATITAMSSNGMKAVCEVNVCEAPNYQVYDFEEGNLIGWTRVGDAFMAADITTDSAWWGGAFKHEGNYHLHGFKDGGDEGLGTLTTANFTLGADGQIKLLIGGGSDIEKLFVGLYRVSDSNLVAKVTGNDHETYTEKCIDGTEALGEVCYIQVQDSSSAGFGHVNIDNLRIPVQSGSPVSVTSVRLEQNTFFMAPQDTSIIQAWVSPSNATNQTIHWSSSDTGVVTVDNSGLATAVSEGEAVITATSDEGGFTAQGSVVVSNQRYLSYNFENADLSGWQVSGSAFSVGDVTNATDWGWGGPFTPEGTYHLWGVAAGGDQQTGVLRSQDFVLGGDGIISFLIGGGFDINTVYIALVRKSDGLELMKATGDDNDSEDYTARQFDASAYVGEELYIKLVDNATGGWGHINLDNLTIPIDNIPTTGVTLDHTNVTITVNRSFQLEANILPGNATNQSVYWGSSNPAVAQVIAGKISAISPGSATITATTVDGNFSAQASVTVHAQDYLFYDFESGDLAGWTTTGNAFVNADVTSDSNWGWGGPFHPQGQYHLWSVKSGADADTGTLRSEEFVLDGDGVISFMLGGGFDINTVFLGLYRASDDLLLMKATGDNNDSEDYTTKHFSAENYVGQKCYLKAVDNAIGGWGHINLDSIRIPVASVDVTGVDLEKSALTMAANTTTRLQATVQPVGATNQKVIWSSSNTSVATVDQFGNVESVNPGNTIISVTTDEGAFVAQADLTVEDQQYLVYDFESGDLSGWTTVGGAFTVGDVTNATNWGWGGPFNPQGSYHLWGVASGGDADTGSIQTDDFVLWGDGKITFMIGGGYDFNTLFLALVRKSDGAILMKATGDDNDSEDYVQKQLDASMFVGTTCYMKLVDKATGGWGHINLDNLKIPIKGNATARKNSEYPINDKQNTVKIYPNPVVDVLYFDLPDNDEYKMSVTGMDGRKLMEGTLCNNELDVSTLDTGMYLIYITSKHSNHVYRIIKR
ncbi:Ig-like domain-containing protein [Marinoscillum furvescens]|uniref:beta-fructofuranosidase n=1 Tax=Marinoscillum furvescens DSM 4134 TaxID=1122208 RepID=A0A3D9LIN8_MARFU|nr:Ig-like domain-containing protein [Marinoscillum furvescens]REE05536.1 putative secreted protein (Por secretion system target) [Marinoscillum furvescens DSM 4134]